MPLTQEGIDEATARIALLPFFPASDRNARAILKTDLVNICHTDEQALWLALRMEQIFKKWPGSGEMRALFCKRFKPADGYETISDKFPEGFPSEHELGPLPIKGLPAPPAPLPIAPPKQQITANGQRMEK